MLILNQKEQNKKKGSMFAPRTPTPPATRRFLPALGKGRLLGGVALEDGSLDGGTVGNGLIRVDRPVGLLSVEEVGDKLDDSSDTSGTTDKNDLVDLVLVDLDIDKDLADEVEGAVEEVLAELLETGTGKGGVEVNVFKEGVDLDEVWLAEERVRLACSQVVHR